MRRFLLAAAAFLALAGATPMTARALPVSADFSPSNTGINGAALNTAPCMTLRVGSFNTLSIYAVLTRSAATSITCDCSAGPSSTILGKLAVATISTAVSLAGPTPTFTYPVSASGTYRWLVSPLADDTIKCCFGGASASGSDILLVYARGVGQQ